MPPPVVHLVLHATDPVLHLNPLLLEQRCTLGCGLLHHRHVLCVVLQWVTQLRAFVDGDIEIPEKIVVLSCAHPDVVSVRAAAMRGEATSLLPQTSDGPVQFALRSIIGLSGAWLFS